MAAHQPLAADSGEGADLIVGTAPHQLNCPVRPGGAELLEQYVFPGGYAHRFDKYDKNGAVQAQEIPMLFQEKDRVVRLRAEAEAAQALNVRGAGDRGDFCPGFTFRLERHFDADDRYLLTRVEHSASQAGTFISGQEGEVTYENTFTCIPATLPFRPPRVTPRPRIDGAQTAVVVGPEESILVDP